MAVLGNNLWQYNFCKVVIVDTSDDFRLSQEPLPSEFYPVLKEMWLPRYNFWNVLQNGTLVGGYLYDWHEPPTEERDEWMVGVVKQDLKFDILPPLAEA